MAYQWNGPNPSLPVAQGGPWAGNLDWNEPRNWNNQPAGGTFPADGDDAGFPFSPPGVVSGSIAFQNCAAGNLVGIPVKVQLSGVNCVSGYMEASAGSEIDVVGGGPGGVLNAFMQGGNCGSSGLLQGLAYNIIAATLGGGLGSNLFQNLTNVVFKHTNPGGIAAIMGAISGFSPLQVGQKNPPIGGDTGINAQLDVFGGGGFTGGVTSEFPYGGTFDIPKLNLKSMGAAGVAGEPINMFGGAVTFTVPTWLGHPLMLNPARGQINQTTALVANGVGGEGGVPLAYYLPDARVVGIKNSGADWRVYCTVDVHQFSNGLGNVNGFVGIDDDVLVTTAAALTILRVKGKHFYGKLRFDPGGKVEF